MRKFYILTLLLLLPLVVNAQEVEIDGINYNLIPKGKVAEVIEKSSGKYTGDITIPGTVTYEETVYNVTSIGDWAFYDCFSLASIKIPNSVTSIGSRAFSDCSKLTSIEIPNSVTSIGSDAFTNCSKLTSIEIPNSVTSIGSNVFNSCSSLTSISIPNSVTSIGGSAFIYCSSLTSISIPSSVTSIGSKAFSYCSSLASITIPNSVTSIGSNAFSGCSSLTSITIPNSVTKIGNSAFSVCSSLTSISIPNSVTSIGEYAFSGCSSLTSIEIPSSVNSISRNAFSGCSSLTSITIPNSVTNISRQTFSGCSSLTAIEIPNSVTYIDIYAFSGCSNLTSITIGKSVKYIYEKAFEKCQHLTDVTCLATEAPKTNSDAFSESYIEYAKLHVPEGSVAAYKATAPWSGFKSIVSVVETKYTLTYQLDGEEYKTYQLAEGDPITPEPAPTKDGYTFSGWSTIPATMPAENLTITGKFEKITTEDIIKIGDSGKLWYCSKYDLDFTNAEGLKAYIAMGYETNSNTLWLASIKSVPAGTGIMVKGNKGDYTVTHAKSYNYYINMFKGDAYKDMQVSKTDGDYTNFYLNKSGQIVPFPTEAVTYPAGRCYLQIPTSLLADPANTRSINYVFDDDPNTTGIDATPATPTSAPDVYYNLQGQRVDNPGKGLYIKNGKKVILK